MTVSLSKFLPHLIFLLGLSLSLAASIFTPAPIGVDFYFHLDVARVWASGQNGMFSEVVMRVNRFPYPPLFHWILVPAIWLGQECFFGRLLQAFFYSGILLWNMVFAFKHGHEHNPDDARMASYMGMLLMSNVAFIDSAIQARPQSLDMLLLPFLLNFFLTDSWLGFTLLSSLMVWNHGVAALALTYALFLVKVKDRKWLKAILLFGLLTAFVTGTSVWHAGGALAKWKGTWDSDQEMLFWSHPLTFIPLYMGILLMGYPLLFLALAKWKSQSQAVKACCLVLAGLTVMLPLWADRWLQYSSIPLAYLISRWLSKRSREETIMIMPVLLFAFLVYQVNYWWVTFTGNWFAPSQSTWG